MTRAWRLIYRWGEMIKFSHSIFALPFALMATFMAARTSYRSGDLPHVYPAWQQILFIVLCMVTARSVAMTFNRVIDAEIDAGNPRTAGRAIPAGTISRRQANAFLFLLSMLFVVSCGGFWIIWKNPWPMRLALPVLAYLCFYSYTKRFTQWSHFVLGSAIAMSPVAAWIAIHPASLGWPAFVLMGAVTLWIGGFDIIYACQDVDFDRSRRLFSLPVALGVSRALRVARIAHAGTVGLLGVLAVIGDLGWLYLAGVAIVAVLLIVENVMISAGDLTRVNVAFLTMNGMVSIVLGVLAIADVLLQPGVPSVS